MTSDLIPHLNILLKEWDTLSEAAAQKMQASDQPEQDEFYAGMLFGMNVARDELAAALATAMVKVAKPSPSLM